MAEQHSMNTPENNTPERDESNSGIRPNAGGTPNKPQPSPDEAVHAFEETLLSLEKTLQWPDARPSHSGSSESSTRQANEAHDDEARIGDNDEIAENGENAGNSDEDDAAAATSLPAAAAPMVFPSFSEPTFSDSSFSESTFSDSSFSGTAQETPVASEPPTAAADIPAPSHGPEAAASARSRLAVLADTLRAKTAQAFAPLRTRLDPAITALAPAARWIRSAWRKRMKFSYVLYAVVFIIVTCCSVLFLQWSVYSEPDYPDGAQVDEATKAAQSVAGQVTNFVSQSWLMGKHLFLLNCLALGMIYLIAIVVINRFWVATALFGSVMSAYAIANSFKVKLRSEPVIPSDLNFVSGGNTGDILSFIPQEDMAFVHACVRALVWFVAICVIVQLVDRRSSFIPTYWRHPIANVKHIAGNVTRLVAIIASVSIMLSFTWNLGMSDGWSKHWAASLGDAPQLWNGMGDAANNGPAVAFLRLSHTKVMDKPEGYSRAAMQDIAKRYADQADGINAQRQAKLTDSTVIMILSESFSDPTRVPGVAFSQDPMPQIRDLKTRTTAGFMFSTGYGGGTANIEYQALTGLSLANYSPQLQIAYQQLVPKQKWTPAFNQSWNEQNGQNSSQALHTFMQGMYFRNINYKKFGFSKFWTMDSDKYKITDCSPIDSAWYASDECTYRNVLSHLDAAGGPGQFMQVVTMQNHMPYNDWYQDNQFKDADASSDLTDGERAQVETYAKGVNYTDQSTMDFLGALNQINCPITVIFYGDHLPGIYPTAYSNPDNVIGLHETDYFIWSNDASPSADTKLPDDTAQYTSSNYFIAQAAAHMNAKVSPYIAFLTRMHEQIPAMSVPSAAGGDNQTPVYLDAAGQRIEDKQLSKDARAALHDYQLIQYDISAGKNYLKDTDFMALR